MISQVFFPKKDCLFSAVRLKRRKTSYTEFTLPFSISHKASHHSGKSVLVFVAAPYWNPWGKLG